MSEEPVDPKPRQEEIIKQVNEHTAAVVAAAVETMETAIATRASGALVDELSAQLSYTRQELERVISERFTTVDTALGNITAGVAGIREQQTADHIAFMAGIAGLGATLDSLTVAVAAVMAESARQGVAVDQIVAEQLRQGTVQDTIRAGVDSTHAVAQKILTIVEGQPDERTWKQTPELVDPKFRPVLGAHTGGGSSFTRISEAMGRKVQVAPIYWKTNRDPTATCGRMLRRGTLPRLELCFPHIVTSLGYRMTDGSGKSFWGRTPDGGYDHILIPLLQSVATLMETYDQPILLSLGHESDLSVEDGSSPKVETNPKQENLCGAHEEYPEYHAHLAALARQYAPRARIFLNWSGGYSDAPRRWSKMLPPADTFDFFGWDPYNMFGKQGDDPDDWQSFESRMKMFGRWDWYKANLPDVPVIIGETGTCAGDQPGGQRDAGQWLLDMIDFTHENRWQGVGTGGGISQVHYFSHHYSAHPRCLDDNGTHKGCASGQKWNALARIGADTRLAWA